MAQAERITNAPSGQRLQNTLQSKSTSKAQTSPPTFQQLLQREGSKWSHISADKLKKNYGKEDERNQNNKKSVLAKVKEKAKKLRHSLSTKKHRDENDPKCTSSTTRSSSDNKGKEDVEYQHIPHNNKPAARDYHHGEALKSIPENNSPTRNDEPAASSSNMITETQSPETDAKNRHDLPESGSRFSGLTVSTLREGDRIVEEGETMKGESQTKDKGVSVKEYLMQKLEPGEDERALSQIIIQTISPRRDKMREAIMSSFLKNEEPESTCKVSNKEVINSSDVSNDTNRDFKSKSLPASVNRESKIASINPTHSLRSNASLDLNQIFKSTVASYQNNTSLNSLTRSSSSPLGHASSADETQAPALNRTDATKVSASNGDQTRVPSHICTNVTRVPVSSAKRSQVPSTFEINTIRLPLTTTTSKAIQVPGQINANAIQSPVSTTNKGHSPVSDNASR